MASETITRLIDDLDGSPADRTVQFAWDGKWYCIDLNQEHIASFEKALDRYLSAARVEGSTGEHHRHGRAKAPSRRASHRQNQAVRDWARANGHEVGLRGRIRAEVWLAYETRETNLYHEESSFA